MQQTQTIPLHPRQSKAYLSDKRLVLCCSGIQGGKSLVGALKLARAVEIQWPYTKFPNVNFAVCAPDYKSLKQSTMDSFRRVFQNMGKFQGISQVFQLFDGRFIFFRTMVKNPRSVEGIPACAFIWADEAGQYPREAFLNMQSRTSFMKGQLFLTTTPYALNWVHREIIQKHAQGDPDIDYIEWTSMDNPAFPKDEFERQKLVLSPSEFRRKYMGIHEALEGLIFQEFGQDNWVDKNAVNLDGARYFSGVDWGFDHPFSCVVRALAKDGGLYTVSIFKRSGLSTSQQLDVLQAKHKLYGIEWFSCGHDRPEMIRELQTRGVRAFKYFEPSPQYREINAGNQKHAELIRSRRYKIIRNIDQWQDLSDEYSTYRWDKKEFQTETKFEKPLSVNDDLMAAERYCTVAMIPLLDKHKKYLQKLYQPKRGIVDHWVPTTVPTERDTDFY